MRESWASRPLDFAVELEGGFESVPNVRMVRTKKYADTFYLDFSYLNAEGILVENGLLEALPEAREARESFLRTEAALNRFLLLVDYLESTDGGFLRATEGVCAQTDRWLIDRICLQAPDITKAPLLRSRWEKHVAFARAGESLRLPYRLGYEFCSSADGIRFGLDVSCPTASTMPSSAWSQETGLFLPASAADRNGAEARYAAHAAILMASLAFSVSSDVEEAYVNCLRGGVASDVVVSGCIRRARFEELFKREESDRSVKDPFAFLRECGVTFPLWRRVFSRVCFVLLQAGGRGFREYVRGEHRSGLHAVFRGGARYDGRRSPERPGYFREPRQGSLCRRAFGGPRQGRSCGA